MKELDFQTLICKSVRQAGGFAHKMSNRFLVGVPDLLIKLPLLETGLWEVKIDDEPVRSSEVKLKVTPPQAKYLRDLFKIGGFAGVISGMRLRDGNLMMAAAPIGEWNYDANISFHVDDYRLLKKGKREQVIVEILTSAFNA